MVSALQDLQSPSQPQSVIALWLVPSYTAWWQRHTGASSSPKATVQWTHGSRVHCPCQYHHHAPAFHLSCMVFLLCLYNMWNVVAIMAAEFLVEWLWIVCIFCFHIRLNHKMDIHCVWGKNNPLVKTVYDRNAKSQRILTELRAVNSEYVCERTTKFRLKIFFDSRVINL